MAVPQLLKPENYKVCFSRAGVFLWSFSREKDFFMEIQKIISPVLFILIAVILRLLPHPPNMAPIAAMALFGGVYLNKRYALVVPLTAMVVSDFFLGFHASIALVYTSFFLTGVLGLWIRKHKSFQTIVLTSLTSSCIFFILTNFNYWYVASLYPKTIEGLLMSYTNALPFFRNTVIGDLFYTGMFFGGYELVKTLTHSKRLVQAK